MPSIIKNPKKIYSLGASTSGGAVVTNDLDQVLLNGNTAYNKDIIINDAILGNDIIKITQDAQGGTVAVYERSDGSLSAEITPTSLLVKSSDGSYNLLDADRITDTLTKNGVNIATVNDITLNPTVVKTANYNAIVNDFVPYNLNGNYILTLPTTPVNKTRIGVKIIAITGSNTLTINTGGSDVINIAGGSTSATLSVLNQAIIYQYNLSTGIWYVLSNDISKTYIDAQDTITLNAAKAYTDTQLATLDSKPEVDYASTSALPANTYANGTSGVGATLTGASNGPLIIDGVTILLAQVGRRVLVAAEAASANNGWYTITQQGVVAVAPYILTRATESDQAVEIGAGYLTGVVAPNGVTAGSNNGKIFISVANDPFIVGTTVLTFSQVGSTYSNGAGLTLSGQVFSIGAGQVTNSMLANSAVANLSNTNTGDETATRIATINHGTSTKTTLVDADEITGQDSANSFGLIRVTCLNVYNYLKSKFDPIYVTLTGGSLTGPINANKGTNIASGSTTNIGASTGEYIHVTGTTTITAFDSIQAGTLRSLVFDGALTLTYNATSMILPGGVNILTAAGDSAIFRSEGSGNWKCISYTTASDTYINYVPTFTGFSSVPTIASGEARYKMVTRNTCHVIIYPSTTGTSNATTFTITLPFAAFTSGTFGLQAYSIPVFDNGSQSSGFIRTRSGSNIADLYKTTIGGAFTGSSTKSCFISIIYHIDI